MSRYLGPKLRIIRRLGQLPGFTTKITERKYPPGQHGPNKLNKKKSTSEYSLRLQEKQKLRYNYGISEKQLYGYIKKARTLKGSAGLFLLQFLEMRLDNILYRLGFASSISSARQFITHSHILVNNKITNIPSFQCQSNDIISVKDSTNAKSFVRKNIQLPNSNSLGNFLELDKINLIGRVNKLIDREEIKLSINELLIVEFYSRK